LFAALSIDGMRNPGVGVEELLFFSVNIGVKICSKEHVEELLSHILVLTVAVAD
jgi:hypothetical protein